MRNFLLIYLHHAVIFVISCSIPLLPYFLKCFGALFVYFLGAKPSLLHDLFVAGFLGTTSRFCTIFLVIFCFLVCSGLCLCIYLVTAFCFGGVCEVFLDFVAQIGACLFWAKIGVLHQFVFARFALFVYFLRLCALALLIRSYASIFQSLTAQNYDYCPLCSVFWPAQS